MNIFLGISYVILGIAILSLFSFFVFPKKVLKYQILPTMRPESIKDDLSCFVPTKENAEFIDSYGICIGKENGHKFASIKYKENVHQIKFYLVFFDVTGKAFDVRVVDVADTQIDKSSIIDIPLKTRGLFLQVISADGTNYDDKLPIYYTNKQLIIASLIHSALITVVSLFIAFGFIFAFVLTLGDVLGIMFDYFPFYSIAIIATYAISFGACYLFLRLSKKKYIKSEEEL